MRFLGQGLFLKEKLLHSGDAHWKVGRREGRGRSGKLRDCGRSVRVARGRRERGGQGSSPRETEEARPRAPAVEMEEGIPR